MFGAFTSFGKLGSLARAIAAAWTPSALWPTGTEPGMWIDPSNLTSQWQDSAGTTPVSTPGTVADSSNPVGLALDLRLGATALTDPGNHLLQATSTARPLLSARVNTLTYTEDFANAVWVIDLFGTATLAKTLGQSDPFGGTSAVRLLAETNGAPNSAAFRYNDGLVTEQVIRSFYIKSNTGIGYSIYLDDTVITLIADTDWHRYDVSEDGFTWGTRLQFAIVGTTDITVAFPQRELGTALTDYQAILTNGSTYTSTGFPVYQHFDGTDDSMATATFAAGTLSSAMDCMIAVRRDTAASMVLGFHRSQGSGQFIAAAELGAWWPATGGAGTPTTYVNGVQLSGGTSTSAGDLHTALTVGNWHILELRGLDLSAWTDLRIGYYGSAYNFSGAFGGALLFPGGNTAERDKARAWLANKVGVTLP